MILLMCIRAIGKKQIAHPTQMQTVNTKGLTNI